MSSECLNQFSSNLIYCSLYYVFSVVKALVSEVQKGRDSIKLKKLFWPLMLWSQIKFRKQKIVMKEFLKEFFVVVTFYLCHYIMQFNQSNNKFRNAKMWNTWKKNVRLVVTSDLVLSLFTKKLSNLLWISLWLCLL